MPSLAALALAVLGTVRCGGQAPAAAGPPPAMPVETIVLGNAPVERTSEVADYLREHPETAAEYEHLKRALAAVHNAADFPSQQAYAEAKGIFVTTVTERALADGYPR